MRTRSAECAKESRNKTNKLAMSDRRIIRSLRWLVRDRANLCQRTVKDQAGSWFSFSGQKFSAQENFSVRSKRQQNCPLVISKEVRDLYLTERYVKPQWLDGHQSSVIWTCHHS